MLHINIIHTPTARSYGDWEVEEEYQSILKNIAPQLKSFYIRTSSMLFINRVRLGVKRGEITAAVNLGDGYQNVNADGTLDDWGIAYDLYFDIVEELIG